MNQLLERFECVRFVRMNGRDLRQFQFDYDQTWAILVLRSDGTVLARYGSRNSRDGMTLNSMAGLESTLRRALQAHEAWPSQRALYQAKRGPEAEYAAPEAIPSPTIAKILLRGRLAEEGCIHCHNIYDAHREADIKNGDYDPWKRWKYPFPKNIGLRVDPDSGTRITDVIPNTPAAEAGVHAGEEILVLAGQAIHSLADIQFALHFLPETAEAELVTRQGEAKPVKRILKLKAGWRRGDIGWRASMYGMPPRPGLWIRAATPEEKSRLKIAEEALALTVRGVFGKEVRQSGLKKGDVIIQFGDRTTHHDVGAFQAALRLNYYQPNAVLPLKLLRDGKPMQLDVTFPN